MIADVQLTNVDLSWLRKGLDFKTPDLDRDVDLVEKWPTDAPTSQAIDRAKNRMIPDRWTVDHRISKFCR